MGRGTRGRTGGDAGDIPAPASIPTAFLTTVERRRDAIALRWRVPTGAWESWTFDDLAHRIAHTAGALRRHGVTSGDRVALVLPNGPALHVVDLATLFCGAIPVAIDQSAPPDRIAALVRRCDASLVVDSSWAATDKGEPIDLADAAERVAPESTAAISYTPGTTGTPKAVMLTHANVIAMVAALARALGEDFEVAGKRVLSYLPPGCIIEQLTGHWLLATHGVEVSCCSEPDELTSCLVDVRPQVFAAVPSVWETLQGARGLEECVLPVSTGGAISPDVLDSFRGRGIPLTEAYGLAEMCGPVTYTRGAAPGTVGRPVPGVEVSVAGGELLCRGPTVFAGYLDEPLDSAVVVDADGWLHTGDVGTVDADGSLRVVGRREELLTMTGGRKISPAPLESALRTVPLVGHACAVGDGRAFVAALVVLDAEVARGWGHARGIAFDTLADLARNPLVGAAVGEDVASVMEPFVAAERVNRVAILGDVWRSGSDVLTQGMKLRREAIHARYATEIAALYS